MDCWPASRRAALTAIAAVFAFISAAAAQSDWKWVRVEPQASANPVTWDVLQGETAVQFDGNHFRAQLEFQDGTRLRSYVLTGTIERDGKVTAKEVQRFTESNSLTFHGVLRKVQLGRGWSAERIILNNDDRNIYLGLMRWHGAAK